MKQLPSKFESREALTALIAETFDAVLIEGHRQPSPIHGRVLSEAELAECVQPAAYARTRNFYDGAVSRLSPFVRQGVVDRKTLASIALSGGDKPAEKFIQELIWGEFWQHMAEGRPSGLWQDAEPYKTGFLADDYASELPQDIATGTTPNACLNHFIRDLQATGYVHNHARMYLAAYVVHFRRIQWQAGAAWFLAHLLDGDAAANNYSWQWVASTFGSKPYIFNLENVAKYCGNQVDCRPETNPELDASYDVLSARLFPARAL
jgi:deoxyribodipyrimidine photo-lyase|tara:strand:+ start:912 stop:1703 length:792 start_codon:yes stop_codon:yes gene_type:complete